MAGEQDYILLDMTSKKVPNRTSVFYESELHNKLTKNDLVNKSKFENRKGCQKIYP